MARRVPPLLVGKAKNRSLPLSQAAKGLSGPTLLPHAARSARSSHRCLPKGMIAPNKHTPLTAALRRASSGDSCLAFHFLSQLVTGRDTRTGKWCSRWEEKPSPLAQSQDNDCCCLRFSSFLTHRVLRGAE